MVAGLHPPQQWDSVPGLSLQLPEPDQLWNKLRLFVETHATNDTIQTVCTCGQEGGKEEVYKEEEGIKESFL